MPTLSVVTPVHTAGAKFLPETAASVHAAHLPAGWVLQWVVQEDGADPELADTVATLGGEYACHYGRGGASMTRNMALLRARGTLVFSLDADDRLLPDAFINLLPRLTPDLGWVCGGHVQPDGTPDRDWQPEAAKHYPTGALLRHGSRGWGFHPNNLLARTDVVWRAGGWPGLSGMEDKMLVMKMNAFAAGASTDVPTVYYRRHPEQSIAHAAFLDRLSDFHAFVTNYAEATLRHPVTP